MYVHTSSYTVFIVWTRQDDTKACALYKELCENKTENIYSTMAQRWSGVTPSSHRNFAKFLRTLFAEGGRLWRHINDRTTRDFNNLEDALLRSLVFDHKEGRQPWKQWAGRFHDRTPAELRSRARSKGLLSTPEVRRCSYGLNQGTRCTNSRDTPGVTFMMVPDISVVLQHMCITEYSPHYIVCSDHGQDNTIPISAKNLPGRASGTM
jgi:hypothetical protein